jgi:hypothetical protein
MAINEFNEPDRDTVRDRLSGDTKTILTPDEYQNRLVDFYSQTLGATGIDVDDDDDKDDGKDDTYVAPNIIPDQSSDGGQSVTPDVLDFQYDIDDVVNTTFSSNYQEHLSRIGRDDKSDLSKFDKSMQESNKKINDNLQKNFGIGISMPTQGQLQKYTAATGVANVFGMIGLPVQLGASMIAGKTEKNIFGVDEFKPSGIPGMIQDVSESMRLDSYNQNKDKYTKLKSGFQMGSGEFTATPTQDLNTYMRTKDYGFSVNSRNAGSAIYRTEGSRIYNGAGMIGIDQETARRIEALKRGYETSNYDPTNPSKSASLVGAGYDERGYHHTVNGVAAMGREKDAIELGKMYGLSLAEVKTALGDVRSRRSTFGRTIEGKTLSQVLAEARDAKQKKTVVQQQQVIPQETGDDSDSQPKQETSFTDTSGQDVYSEGFESYGDDNNDSGGGFGSDTSGTMGGEEVAMGGRIGKQEGDVVVKEPGFIAPDPNATKQQEIADDKPMDARQGDFIINAPAAEEAGKQDIQRMINTAITNLQEKGVDVRFGDPKINIADKVKLLVSRNEVYIPAIIAKEIGYDRLKKINNRGKREVQRRQEESQQDEKSQARGFIQKKKGDVVATADYSEGGIDATSGMLLRLTGHLKNIEQGLGEGFKYGKKSKAGDTLRHILTSGYISEDGFFNKFMSDLFDGREISENMSEENRVDLNNNKFGRLLRQKYPDRMEFTKQARQVVKDLLKGKKTEIDGVSPMLSVKAE